MVVNLGYFLRGLAGDQPIMDVFGLLHVISGQALRIMDNNNSGCRAQPGSSGTRTYLLVIWLLPMILVFCGRKLGIVRNRRP